MTFGRLGGVVKDLFDALVNRRLRAYGEVFRQAVVADVRGAFAAGADPATGVPWPPLKSRRGRPLVLTGALEAAAVAAAGAGQLTRDGYTAVLATPAYGIFHQLGTRRTPRRRFFAYSPETARRARQAFAAELVQLIVE